MQNKRVPLRTCISCRESKDKRELVRIVKTPTGEILVDSTGKLNGRGAYVCNNPDCFEKLKKNHGLERAFKENVSLDFLDDAIKELFGENK
ncbi:MAG: YlxR family protein [Lachnospiraceae bacterium]|nr:YlxR family protein [Lachnospiraceae bacterium]